MTQILCCDEGGGGGGGGGWGLQHGRPKRCDKARQRVRARDDTAGYDLLHDAQCALRHSAVRATTQCCARYDTVLCARPGRSVRTTWVQAVHLVHSTQF